MIVTGQKERFFFGHQHKEFVSKTLFTNTMRSTVQSTVAIVREERFAVLEGWGVARMGQLVLPEFRRCKDCGKVKVLGEGFYKGKKYKGKQYYDHFCKICQGIRNAKSRDREGQREYQKRWYRANREKVLTKGRQRYRANRREILAKATRLHKENPEKGRAYARQWYVDHREERLEETRRYRKNNPKKVKEAKRRWCKANPEKGREAYRRRRTRIAGSTGAFTDAQFQALCAHYGNICLCCGKPKELHRDHVVPLSKGGSNDISNIQPLCQSCNSSKGTQSTDYRMEAHHG